jgi:membrane-bound inhibitor of C-type lysozyme
MSNTFGNKKLLMPVILLVLMSGCGGARLWPFGDDKPQVQSNKPVNSTEYRCSEGKKFYVRNIDNGNSVWLILPDREVSLTKAVSDSGKRFSNGISTLNIMGDEATLDISPTSMLTGCKAGFKQ